MKVNPRLIMLARSLTILLTVLAGFLPGQMAHAAGQAVPGVDPNFYKLTIGQAGMYSVSYAALAAAGLPVDTLDPATFQLYEQGSEIARQVVDADGSGTFNAGDYILFYGRAVDTDFTGTNIYWLTYGVAPGLEMGSRDGTPAPGLPSAATFRETLHFEQNKLWVSSAPMTGVADHWYWQNYQPACDRYGYCVPAIYTYTLQLPGVATGTHTATLTPRLRGNSDRGHLANFYLNGNHVGDASFDRRDEFLGSLSFPQNMLIEGSNTLTLTSPYDGSAVKDIFLVNWFEVSYQRTYTAPTTGQFAFGVDMPDPSAVTVTNIQDSSTAIYDITDPQHPVRITGIEITPGATAGLSPAAGFSITFAHRGSAGARYIAAAPAQYLSPGSITPDTPSHLRSPTEGADWIIISHRDFLSAAQTLAGHRQAQQGYRTAVVDVQDIYDEFNGGLPDQEAIRAFLRYAYEHWPRPAPQYVVLLGDGHYDPRNYLGTNAPTFIPPYLAAVDPFEGLTAADNRYVAYDPVPPTVNPVPFMHLGRLPANTLADAQAMVNKIISYETGPTDLSWQRQTTFVADNPDYAGDFWANSDMVADNYTLLPAEYNRQKIYYQANTPASQTTAAIVDAINAGTLLLNYHGHASWRSWASEGIWQVSHLSQLTNQGRYPVVLVMGCLEGYFIVPYANLQSLGESIVRQANAGAVASWSPAGKGVAAGHDVIFQAFYEAIFGQGITQIGAATSYAKAALDASSSPFKDLIDTYILFGDPAMPLKLAAPDLWVEKTAQPSGPWHPGEQVRYVIRYGNSGSALSADVVITDIIPAQVLNPAWEASNPGITAAPGPAFVWRLATLNPGDSGTITVTGTVDPELNRSVAISNVALISGNAWESPAQGANNSSRADTTTVLPTGFNLELFESSWTADGARVRWVTRSETGVEGYNVYRTTVPHLRGKRVNPELIRSAAPPEAGAEYTLLDTGVTPGETIYYWLETTGFDAPIWFGPVLTRWPYVSWVPLVGR